MILNASMELKNLGNVITISDNVVEQLQWTSKEIVGKPVSAMLMPGGFNRLHPKILANHLTSRNSNKLNTNLYIAVKSKSGEIFPAYVYLALYPKTENGI